MVGVALGAVIAFIRWRLDDPLVESAVGLVAPFVIYLAAEEIHGSGVLAVVVAALILGQQSTHAGYATRLQDDAVWKALQLILESFAFLMIGLQLPMVVGELHGHPCATMRDLSSVAVLGDGDRGPDRLGVRVRLSAAAVVHAHPGTRTGADARAGVRRRVGGHARRGVAGRGVRRAADDAVGRAVPRPRRSWCS